MILEWLRCPVCGEGGETIDIWLDGEHIELECEVCETKMSEYHSEYSAFN